MVELAGRSCGAHANARRVLAPGHAIRRRRSQSNTTRTGCPRFSLRCRAARRGRCTARLFAVNTALPPPLALFGGTFDPVHFGHLRVAQDTANALKLPEVRLIPSQMPVHRTAPGASAAERMQMLRLAIPDFPALSVDDCELIRSSASYTITTLESFRAAFPTRPLIWLVGVDAFMKIQTWHRARDLFGVAHFVVLNRPGFPTANVFSAAMSEIWQGRVVRDPRALREALSGSVYVHTVAPQAISATEIRAMIARNAFDPALSALLPEAVLAYIRAHGLYGARSGPSGSP